MIEKGFPDFHRSNLCKFSSSIHILISRDQTGLRDRCHLVTDSAQLHMSCRWISNTMGPAAILFWCGMLMDPKIRLRSCTDPCAAGSGHTRLQTSNKPCSTMQKVAPEPIKKLKYVEICWNMLKYVEICWNMLKYVEICWNHRKSLNFCWFPQRNKHQLLVQLWVELLPVEVGPLRQRRLVVLVVLVVVAADGAVVGRVAHLLEEETHLAVRYHGWPDDIPVQTPTK